VDPGAVSGGGGAGGAGGVGGPAAGAPVNLNSATAEQLDTLPGIGPATAAAIISDRDAHGPFRSVNDLGRVRGIGDAKLDQLRDLVTV
jgi:competence protein ComEA